MPELNKNQLDIIDHTAHRTANGCFCGDSADMQELVELGIMEYIGKTVFCPDMYFRLTSLGRTLVK